MNSTAQITIELALLSKIEITLLASCARHCNGLCQIRAWAVATCVPAIEEMLLASMRCSYIGECRYGVCKLHGTQKLKAVIGTVLKICSEEWLAQRWGQHN